MSQNESKSKLSSALRNGKYRKRIISVLIVGALLFAVGFSPNSDLIVPTQAYTIIIDNNVDADSNVDSTANIGTDGAFDYTDAQSLDGTDQEIVEGNEGGGGAAIQAGIGAKIMDKPNLIDGGAYSSSFGSGVEYWGNGHVTDGVSTYLGSGGNYKETPMTVSYKNVSGLVDTDNDEIVDSFAYNYVVKAGTFNAHFYNTSVKLEADGFSFIQQINEVGLFNYDTTEYEQKALASKPSSIVVDAPNKELSYMDVFGNTDIVFSCNGTHLKETIESTQSTWWGYPSGWEQTDTYLVFWSKISDIYGVDVYDDDGEILSDKIVNGIIRWLSTDTGQLVKAFMPVGQAWAKFSDNEDHYTPVESRIKFRDGNMYVVSGIKYNFVVHAQRTGKLFIDPTWQVGSKGDSWEDSTELWQTEINDNGSVVLESPYTVGNVTSTVREASRSWVKIKYNGSLNGETVDLYFNSSRDNGVADPYQMNLVQSNAQPNTNYSLPFGSNERFGKWRAVLHNSTGNSPEIYSVTLFNDPPNVNYFTSYKELTIDNTQVEGSSDHNNISSVFLMYDTDLHDDVQADGDDIAFAINDTWCDHEVMRFDQSYNNSHAFAAFWVRIPTLRYSLDTNVTMYYGNATMGAQENSAGTWVEWESVHNLQEEAYDGTSGEAVDSTGNHDLTGDYGNKVFPAANQTSDPYDSINGGGFPTTSVYFDGLGDDSGEPGDILISDDDYPSDWSEITQWAIVLIAGDYDVRIWGNSWGTSATDNSLVQRANSGGMGARVRTDTASNTGWDTGYAGNDEWMFQTLSWDTTSDTLYRYQGLESTWQTAQSIGLSGNEIYDQGEHRRFAAGNLGDLTDRRGLDGNLAQLRVANQIFTEDYSESCYNNMFDNSDWFTIGAETALVEPANYNLEWEHQVSTPAIDIHKNYYEVCVYGFSTNASEDFEIQMWNYTSSAWSTALATSINDTETWWNQTFSKYYVDNTSEQVTWRYRGDVESSDTTQTTLSIDYAGIKAYNFSIDGLPPTHNSLDFSVDDQYHAFADSPFSFYVETGVTYTIQIKGTDGTGNPVSGGFIYFDTDSNPSGSTALTISYQTLYASQGVVDGNNTHQVWIWVNYGWTSGDPLISDGSKEYILTIKIIPA